MARYISFAVLLAIIVVIGALFYKVMIGFFVPVFLAAVLVVVFRPLHRWVCSKVGDRDHISAGITTALILLIVLIPAGLILTLAAIQGASLITDVTRIPSSIQVGLAELRKNNWINLEYPHADYVRGIQERVTHVQTEVTNQQFYDNLIQKEGNLQGEVKAIRGQVRDLPKTLVDYSIRDAERQILRLRGNEGGESETLRQEIAKVFSDAKTGLEDALNLPSPTLPLLGSDASETPVETASSTALSTPASIDLERLKSIELAPISGVSSEELLLLTTLRNKFLDTASSWGEALHRFSTSLDQLDHDLHVSKRNIARESGRTGDDSNDFPSDIIEFQREALHLSEEWSHTKNTLLGGEWVGLLKELANPTPEQVRSMTTMAIEYLQPRLMAFTGDSFAFLVRLLVGAVILLLSLYFFLCDGPAMIRTIMELSPLDDRYELELLAEFDRISRAIVLATVLSALFQGAAAGIGYYFVGMPSLILLTALTATCALVPFVGPAIVWFPVCIYLALNRESFVPAIGLFLWGSLVVGSVDNIVKILVLHGQSQLHPLLALLSVLGGIQALGPIGILIGPMVVVLLQTLLGILRQELGKFKKQDEEESKITTAEVRDLSVMIRKPKGKKQGKNAPAEKEDPPAASSGEPAPQG